MIRVFAFRAFVLSIVFALLSGAAIFVGYQQPSEWVTLLHLDDCELPCWIGIEPGKTTFSEARQKIDNVYGNTSYYLLEDYGGDELRVTERQTNYGLDILLSSGGEIVPQPIVSNISLSPFIAQNGLPSAPTIGEVWSNLGRPEALFHLIGSYENVLIMSYQQQQIAVYMNDPNECNQVTPNQQIGGISLGDQSYQPASIFGGLSSPLSWQGFYKCNNFEN